MSECGSRHTERTFQAKMFYLWRAKTGGAGRNTPFGCMAMYPVRSGRMDKGGEKWKEKLKMLIEVAAPGGIGSSGGSI